MTKQPTPSQLPVQVVEADKPQTIKLAKGQVARVQDVANTMVQDVVKATVAKSAVAKSGGKVKPEAADGKELLVDGRDTDVVGDEGSYVVASAEGVVAVDGARLDYASGDGFSLMAQASGVAAGAAAGGGASAAAGAGAAGASAAGAATGGLSIGTMAAIVGGGLALAGAGGGGGNGAPPPPRFALTKDKANVDEGGTVVFTLTDSTKAGGEQAYRITGVDADDVVGGKLTGLAKFDSYGKAFIEVQLRADRATEGAQTLTLTVAGVSQSVTVNDTSLSPTFTLERNAEAVDEGGTAIFTLQATNLDQDVTYEYVITGVLAADVVGGSLTGTARIDANGRAEIRVTLIEDRATEGAETLTLTVAGAGVSRSVTVNDTSTDQDVVFTTGTDRFVNADAGSAADNLYVGRVGSSFMSTGSATTFQDGDAVDGGAGSNTLRLTMDPGATADGVEVSNIQTLDLRLTESGSVGDLTTLTMTDWDTSLEKIDIVSNKSNLEIAEQMVVADVSISDLSTAERSSSYTLGYAAGVLDGIADGLNLSVDNVNGTEGSNVSVAAGMESIAITVADRLGAQYASDINLAAAGVTSLGVTGGRSGQVFTLNADVGGAADFSSTTFLGNMKLTSGDIKTARFGSGSDKAFISGWADNTDASYQLGAGNNEITFTAAGGLAGTVTAGDGNDTVTVLNATGAVSSIAVANGTNTVSVGGAHAGSITGGTGVDTVTARSTAARSLIAVGDGANTVVVTNAHAGAITGGTGADTVTAGSTAALSSIAVGDGANTVVVTNAHAGAITGGTGADTVTAGSTAALSSIAVGNGTNIVAVTNVHAGAITSGTGGDTVTAGSTVALSSIAVGDGANRVTVTGAHAGSVTGGADVDTVVVGGMSSGSSIVTLGGADAVTVNGNMYDATINVGEGNGNSVTVTGNVSAAVPGSILFGNGNNNVLGIGGSLFGDDVQIGTGSGNQIVINGNVTNGAEITVQGTATTMSIGLNVDDSTITLGNGSNVATIKGDVQNGSTITFGSGADTLTLGVGDNSGSPELRATDVATEIKMGNGNDQVTMLARNDIPTNFLVRSGGFMDGGVGNDTLTLRTEMTVDNLIARTERQQVTVDFTGKTFTVAQVVSITFVRGVETFTVSHTVSDADFVQGPDGVAVKVAEALAAKLDDTTAAYDNHFSPAALDGAKLTINSDVPHKDFTITSPLGLVDVVQISDTRISSFETVELVALDGAGESNISMNANFELIEGTNTIKLDSKVDRTFAPVGGVYTDYGFGGVSTFNLTNLKGGEQIHVAGRETGDAGLYETGTGNAQVSTITVGNGVGDHVVGDKISVAIGDLVAVYIVKSSDLVAGTEQLDANAIATSLKNFITSEATAAGMTVTRVNNVLTLVGQPGVAVDISVNHIREATVDVLGTPYTEADGGNGSAYDLKPYVGQLQVGDVVEITIGGDTFSYTVQASDLDPHCERTHAEIISENISAAALAAGVDGVSAQWGAVNFDGGFTVTVSRVVDLLEGLGENTFVDNTVQIATSTDDGIADVIINASLAADATNTTMDLTVAGYGHFDLSITGNGEDTGYTDLALTLADSFDHTINLNGGTYTYVAGDIQGNFSNSVTVDGGVAGQNIILEDVLASDVNTATSAANFAIDQLAPRGEDLYFAGETITVTTGTGNDHLTTLAQSAMESDSSINLGTGVNRLSLGWGNGGSITDVDLTGVGVIDYSGNLKQLDILNNVVLGEGTQTTLTMPGGVTGVEVLTFTDVAVSSFDGTADLTILGAASNFRIESESDFGVDDDDLIALKAVGVENLSVYVDDQTHLDLNGASLKTVAIEAGDDIDLVMDGSAANNGNFVNLSSIRLQADDNIDVDLSNVRSGASLEVFADADRENDGYARVVLSAVTLDNVTVEMSEDLEDGFVSISGPSDSNTSVGDVLIRSVPDIDNVGGSDQSSGRFDVSDNDEATVGVGAVTIAAGEAVVYVYDNDDASVTVDGGVSLHASTGEARLEVAYNDDATVSVAAEGDIDIVSCTSDASVSISDNDNNNDPFGSDPNASGFIKDTLVALGNVSLNAGSDASVDISGNDDNTYFGNAAIEVGTVDMLAYSDADLTISSNDAASVSVGAVTMRAQDNGSVVISSNHGNLYSNTLANPVRFEADFAAVSIDSVAIVADATAGVTIRGQDLATVTVGDVTLTGGDNAGLQIHSNGQGEDSVYYADLPDSEQPVDIALGNVTITALDGSAGVAIGLDFYSPYIEGSDGNVNTQVSLGELTIDAQGSDAALVIAFNEGSDGEGGVDIEKVTMTSNKSGNFFVYENAMVGAAIGSADLLIGAVSITSKENANLSIFGNAGSDGGTDMVMDFGNVTLMADSDSNGNTGRGNAQFEFGSNDESSNANAGNDDVDATFGTVTLTGSDAMFLVKGNTDSSATFGVVKLDADGTVSVNADVKVVGNVNSYVEIASVDIDSSDEALLSVSGNSDSEILIGDVEIDAVNGAGFFVTDNSDSFVAIGASVDVQGLVRGSITIDAGSVGYFGSVSGSASLPGGEDGAWGFEVSGNTGFLDRPSGVLLGDITVDAAGLRSSSDVTMLLETAGEYSVINTGDITLRADSDVFFKAEGVVYDYSYLSLAMGDVSISAGREVYGDDDTTVLSGDDVSSDIYFSLSNVEASIAPQAQTISLNAQSRGTTGEGNVYATIDNAPDLTSLTVAGTNAELYLAGATGHDLDGMFTLDMSKMTGSFSNGAENYVPQGWVYNTFGIDNGVYAETWDADIDNGTVVNVVIGASDLIYNANHSAGGVTNEWGAPWDTPQTGWYSLGFDGDFTPVPQTQVITGYTDNGDVGNGLSFTWYNAIQFEQNGQSYRAQTALNEFDPSGGADDQYFDIFTSYAQLIEGDWVYITKTEIEAALGIDNIGYNGAYSGSWTLTGATDGTAFAAVGDVSQVKFNSGFPNITDEIYNTPTNLLTTNYSGDLAQDNIGQYAAEVFSFTGHSVGEIVLGGFNAGAWNQVNNGAPTDVLDFSKFDWTGVDLGFNGLVDLADFTFTIQDGDGYFKDVIIDTRVSTASFDSIRLVGAGEGINALDRVQESMNFHAVM